MENIIRCLWMIPCRSVRLDLDDTMDNQLDMFTMEHENQYGEMMNELINIFIPPENATKDEMDEAKATWISMRITGPICHSICSRSYMAIRR